MRILGHPMHPRLHRNAYHQRIRIVWQTNRPFVGNGTVKRKQLLNRSIVASARQTHTRAFCLLVDHN